MRFRAELNDSSILSGFLAIAAKFAKSIQLHLKPDVISVVSEHSVSKAVVNAQFATTFFSEYKIVSKYKNEIMLCFDDVGVLITALRPPTGVASILSSNSSSGTSSPATCSLRLAKESYGAVLHISVSIRGPDGSPFTVNHIVPTAIVAVESPPIVLPRLSRPLLTVHTPPSSDFKRAVSRFTPFSGDRITVRADSVGALCVAASTVGIDIAAFFSNCTVDDAMTEDGAIVSATVSRDLFDAMPVHLAGVESAYVVEFMGSLAAAPPDGDTAMGTGGDQSADVRMLAFTARATGCEVAMYLPVVAGDSAM